MNLSWHFPEEKMTRNGERGLKIEKEQLSNGEYSRADPGGRATGKSA